MNTHALISVAVDLTAAKRHQRAVSGTCYGPILKALSAPNANKRESPLADLHEPIARFNRGKDGSMAAPSEYLEIVIERR